MVGLRHLRNWLGTALFAGGAALVLASCTFPVRFATPEEVQQATAPTPITIGGAAVAPAPAPGGLDQIQADLRKLIGQVSPSVVRVDAGTASGNGLLIDSAGTLVTPASLVAGSQQVTVTTSTGQKYTGVVAGTGVAVHVTDPLAPGSEGYVYLFKKAYGSGLKQGAGKQIGPTRVQ